MLATARLSTIGITVFERGWLSSNNVLFQGKESTALVDSGYCTHAEQTVALVQDALQTRPLDLLLNTHLHSDHCGGNASLQSNWPHLTTLIPPGDTEPMNDAEAIRERFQHDLAAVIDAGACALAPTTVVDLTPMGTGGDPEVLRTGQGSLGALGL